MTFVAAGAWSCRDDGVGIAASEDGGFDGSAGIGADADAVEEVGAEPVEDVFVPADAGEESGSDSGSLCGNRPPAEMVQMPHGYFIDCTEVTRCQYQSWLDTDPSVEDQDEWCKGNTDFHPSCYEAEEYVCSGWACGNHPQVCVDWCDATAYCRGVGKRLCGDIGGGPVPVGYPERGEWYEACSAGGSQNFPYGNDYDPDTCNGEDKRFGTTLPVGSLADCQSSVPGYAGVFDMSGNAMEWEDACDGTRCRARGGGSVFPSDWLACRDYFSTPVFERLSGWGMIGFRCCADDYLATTVTRSSSQSTQ
jgi:formylglycine-generating enzyme required for sulfatase activity